ncbi:MAG: RluA family pseudouridine synthase [Clostridia bacterium]|nr:RluA family pseudouridine synthase [Clostridia bacterium]
MDYRKIVYEIEEQDAGRTVLSFLKSKGFSARVLGGLKRNPYGITIGRKRVTVQKQLKKGDTLTVRIANRESQVDNEHIQPVDIPLTILYEDEDVLVVDKPPHLAVHPTLGNRGATLAGAVAFYMKKQNREFVFRPIHRLDKDTSGVILLGKNAHSAGVLGEDLKKKNIERTYLAILEGILPEKDGTVDAPIARRPGSVLGREVNPSGEQAITHYKVLQEKNGYSLVALKLDTGRTHQIRVHMSYLGAPVAGDFLYGTEDADLGRHALHSASLRFTQPVTGEKLHFICPLPEQLKAYLAKHGFEGDFHETFDF